MPEPSTGLDDSRERQLKLAAAVVSVLAVLYGVLIAGQILAPIALVLWAFVVYLAWRFVRAHERLARAAGRLADAQSVRETDATPTPADSAEE